MSKFSHMHLPIWTRSAVAVMLALVIAISAFGSPARAETAGQQSTRTLILTGLAVAAGIILYNNYHHKQVAANSIVGYTRDGGVVHGDGRITYPDGTVLYTGTGTGQRCTYMGYGVPCGQQAYAYRGYYGYPNRGYPNQGYYPQQYQPANYNRGYQNQDRDDRRDRDDRKRHKHRPNNGNDDNNGNGNGNDDGGDQG